MVKALTALQIYRALIALQKKRDQIVATASELLTEFRSSHKGRVWIYEEMVAAMESAFRRKMPANPVAKNRKCARVVFIFGKGYEGPVGDHAAWIFDGKSGKLLPNSKAEVPIVAVAA